MTLVPILLGSPHLRWEGEALTLQPRHLALVCYLALNGPTPRDDLAELLWGPGKSANLRTALYNLRHAPGADVWLQDGERVCVVADSDVGALEQAVQTATFTDVAPLLTGDDLTLLSSLKAPTPAYDEWLAERRQRVGDLLSDALWGAAQACRNQGQLEQARLYAHKLTLHSPEHEAAYRMLMRLSHEGGDAEGVRTAFERLLAALADLGGEPAPESYRLRAELLGAEGAVAQGTRYTRGDAVPGRAAELVGRAELLASLAQTVGVSANARPTLLHGFGGVGKTALAAEFAQTFLETGDVLWLHAGRSSEAELLAAARGALGLTGTDPDALGAALGRVSLLVCDDVWHAESVAALLKLVPPGLNVLATSRQRLPGFARVPLGGLERESSRRLLAATAERELPEGEADTLCHVLGDHPFALRLAGTQLRDGATGAQLLARLANTPHLLEAPKSWRDEERESISALLGASLDGLSDAAYHAFLAMGALGSSSATPEFLSLCTRRDLQETETALTELQHQALLERRATPGSDVVRYLLHDLSYSFSRHNTTLRARSVLKACRAFVAENSRAFELLGAEMPNLIGALETARDLNQKEELVEIMACLVVGDTYFSARGHSPRSLKLLEVALGWAKELGMLERAHYFATKIGDAHRALYHHFDKALDAYRDGVRLARFIRDSSREAIVTSLCAITRHHLGQSSEDDFERARQLAHQSDDSLALGVILQHRSYVAWSAKNWQAMEVFSREAIKLAQKLEREQKVDPAEIDDNLFHAVLNLGEARHKQGFFSDALGLRQQALDIAVARDNRLWQAYALHELGEMYAGAKDLETARTYFLQALELYRENNAFAETDQVQAALNALEEPNFTPS